jgi:hypothetical protein
MEIGKIETRGPPRLPSHAASTFRTTSRTRTASLRHAGALLDDFRICSRTSNGLLHFCDR